MANRLGLGMGIGMGGGRKWTPAAVPGHVYTIRFGPGNVFSDVAGTVPIQFSGTAVAAVRDAAGVLRYTQATPGFRPTLHIDGMAGWLLQFDGADDYLEGGDQSANFTGAGCVSFRAYTATIDFNYEIMNTSIPPNTNVSFAQFAGDGHSYPNLLRGARLQSKPGIGLGWNSVTVRSDATSWTRRLNGVQDVAATPADALAAGFDGGAAWRIGAANYPDGNRVNFFNGYFRGLSVFAAIPTDQNAAKVEAYLAG